MKWNDVFCNTFEALAREAKLPERNRSFVDLCRSDDSAFCRRLVSEGVLTEEQMARAADLYQLGSTRSGKPIFWMIDTLGFELDGRIGDRWFSDLLKLRLPETAGLYHPKRCLFGEHLLTLREGPVAIVGREESAVVLSALYPEVIWLAYSYPANATLDRFEALTGRTVTIYPPTDETMSSYLYFVNLAQHVGRRYQVDISVSKILEEHASEEQKRREIDLLEFISVNSEE